MLLMMKKLMNIVLMAAAVGCASAQTLKITGKLDGSMPPDLKLFVMPVGEAFGRPDSLVMEGGRSFKVETKQSPYHIYKVVGAANRRQVIVPFHVVPKAGTATLSLAIDAEGNIHFGKSDADTKALVAFSDINAERGKIVWMQGKDMDGGRLKALVLGYADAADSLISVHKPSAVTAQYLRLWASTLTFETLESLRFATGRTPVSVGIDVQAEVALLVQAVDCPMAASFDSSPRLLLASIPEGSLAERLAAVYATVKDAGLKSRVAGLLMDKYIATFPYDKRYDEGLKELTELTGKFGLDQKYLREFKVRKASIAGTPFPEGVTLCDLEGNRVDFGKYRGKYVYVDLWASWCVPCIKEIPHLKAVEKELQGENVVFVSVSIDTDDAAWKKKVSALGLEGELLINKDNSLPKALNVSGIPFFLIYDKEGKLYKYNAYRPSDVRLKPLLQGLN